MTQRSPEAAPWSAAWERALYGPGGFWRRHRPREHFRTSVHVGAVFAHAVRELAGRVDAALGRPDPFDLVDLGAGGGELLDGLPGVPPRWRLTAVERGPDPATGLRWRAHLPELTGLLVANEWLDAVPLDVVEDGRLVQVTPDGREVLGEAPSAGAVAWCARWWPGSAGSGGSGAGGSGAGGSGAGGSGAGGATGAGAGRVRQVSGSGGRAEVGLSRDLAWRSAVRQVRRGVAVAVDYGHLRGERRETLVGYRAGRQVRPVPDGSCDLTAHVALDSCAAATGSRLLRQADALRALGVGSAPPAPQRGAGPAPATAERLVLAGAERELLDPGGLGSFGWLVHARGVPPVLAEVPDVLPSTRTSRPAGGRPAPDDPAPDDPARDDPARDRPAACTPRSRTRPRPGTVGAAVARSGW